MTLDEATEIIFIGAQQHGYFVSRDVAEAIALRLLFRDEWHWASKPGEIAQKHRERYEELPDHFWDFMEDGDFAKFVKKEDKE